MNDDPRENRQSFSLREGYESLPSPMQLEELSPDLRREIWNAIWEALGKNSVFGSRRFHSVSGGPGSNSFFDSVRRILGHRLEIPHDEIRNDFFQISENIKSIILNSEFNKLLDFLEDFSCLDGEPPSCIAQIFDLHIAAYWLDTSKTPPQFIPRSSPEEGEAIRRALETVEGNDFAGASAHLREAAKSINSGQFAQAVEESVKAVESVSRSIDPDTLGKALNILERKGLITHPALKKAFSKLYGYTSDKEGIRHALLSREAADVAQFMFGACASFAAYLINQHRKICERQGTGR